MGRLSTPWRAYLQTALPVRRHSVANYALSTLADRIIASPSHAGESHRFLETPPTGSWRYEWSEDISMSDFVVHDGQQRLSAALYAERILMRTKVEIRSRKNLLSELRALFKAARGRAEIHDGPTRFSVDHVALPPVFTSGAPCLNRLTRGPRAVDSRHTLVSAATDWASLQTGLAYWRRTADELWRALAAPMAPLAEPEDIVSLDTAPCGIRRLSAVLVPRAPGAERTSPVPESSLLAAA
ncbi:hypothetical protein AMK21_30055 [Streptomyces sp. CB00316]|nr:hypothetical protein AMK21_30055 [Streptomyces sp. CB00316]